MQLKRLSAAAIVATLAVLASSSSAGAGAAHAQAPARKAGRLQSFDSCAALVRYGRRFAERTDGRVGLGMPARAVAPPPPSPPAPPFVPPTVVPLPDGTLPPVVPVPPVAASPAPSLPSAGRADSQTESDFSTTNVQEEGVDEPDVLKSDGRRLFAVAGSTLHAIDARAQPPALLGSLALPSGSRHELLLRGERLLVLSEVYAQPAPAVVPGGPVADTSIAAAEPARTTLTEVDVADPAAMRVLRSMSADGGYLTARLTGATARVVLSAWPRALRAETPPGEPSEWVPGYMGRPRGGGRRVRRPLLRCRAVRRATSYSGLGMLTVLTIDLERGLPAIDADAVMTDAQTVYGSPSSLYLATPRWIDPTLEPDELPSGPRTTVHKLDVSQPDQTTYRASGELPGALLNQFSLSERGGVLRAATTQSPQWWPGGPPPQSQSLVTTYAERDGRLVELGRVGGLGLGERIFSVRFVDDVGFVVTFRQTDPLYTVDLSDPAQPRVLGELKILGFSSYLHPLGRDLLIGVGQDATEAGRQLGSQVSLFDVSDPRTPRRLHALALEAFSSSEVQWDHRAFLHWPPTGLAVLPLAAPSFTGAVGLRVDRAGGIAELGRVSHESGDGVRVPVRRAAVVGQTLFTLSDRGVMASALGTLAPQAMVAFPPG